MQKILPPEILGEQHIGIPIVLIPGLGADNRTWAGSRAQLAKHHRVIALNNRGIGVTENLHEAYTTRDMMDDVVRQLNHLDIETAYVLGHSLGGAVAQLLAAHHPERVKKLALICTRPFFGKKSVFIYDLIIKYLEMGLSRDLLIQNLFLFLFGNHFFENESNAENLIHITAAMPPNVTLPNYRLQVEAALAHDSRTVLSKIHMSTLVMIGAEDIMCLPEYSMQLAREIPHAELSVLEKVGHMPFIEDEDLFVAKILSFWGQT